MSRVNINEDISFEGSIDMPGVEYTIDGDLIYRGEWKFDIDGNLIIKGVKVDESFRKTTHRSSKI